MTDKLKPCPFCGSADMANKTIMPTLLHKSDCYMLTRKTEAWNTRSPDPLVGELVSALKDLTESRSDDCGNCIHCVVLSFEKCELSCPLRKAKEALAKAGAK